VTEYAEYLARARERFARQEAATVDQLRRAYLHARESVLRDLRDLPPDARRSLQARHWADLAMRLDQRASELSAGILDALHVGIRVTSRAAADAGAAVTASVIVDRAASVRAMFADINERAAMAFIARTGRDGLQLSDRVWRVGRNYRRAILNLTQDAVVRGEDAKTLARRLERYLQPGARHEMSDAVRRRLKVPADISYEAYRLAATELNNSFHESTIMVGRATPGYQGIYWRLSPAHKIPDVCDDLAAHNGTGFWPAGSEPSKPHPLCRCHIVPRWEATGSLKARLRRWLGDPGAEPDLETWYQTWAGPFVDRSGLGQPYQIRPSGPALAPQRPQPSRPSTPSLLGPALLSAALARHFLPQANRQEVLGYIMDANPPEQVRSGLMTPAQWADQYMSDEPGGYVLQIVHPAALFMPTPAGDEAKVREYSRLEAETVPPVVLDSNDKLQARFDITAGGLKVRAGLLPYVVLDGKHRVEAALDRGDGAVPAYVPRRLAARVRAYSHTAELHDFADAYFREMGYAVLIEGERQWVVRDREGRQREFLARDMELIARRRGHRFAFVEQGEA